MATNTIKSLKDITKLATQNKENVITNNNRSNSNSPITETETFSEEPKTGEKLQIPAIDKIKYNIKNEDVINELDSEHSHTFFLKDGRVIKHAKKNKKDLTLKEIITKDSAGRIKTIESFDEKGNLVSKKEYQYGKDGKVYSITTTDKKLNTITTEQYLSTGKKTKVTDLKTNKLLNDIEYDNNGQILSKNSYCYDDEGNVVAISTYNGKTNKSETKYYEDGMVIISFPFDMLDSDTNSKGFSDYTNYEDVTRLSEPLSTVLSTEEIKELNQKINENVDAAGRGTGAGVAAAAVTLITELHKKGILLPYYYKGGHADFELGVSGDLGSDVDPTGGQKRSKKSFDCSGFARWCIEMGGIECPGLGAGSFAGLGNVVHSCEELEPGSVLDSNSHVVMVLDKYTDANGEWHIICAESTGSFANEANYDSSQYTRTPPDNEGGVIITDKSESEISGYLKVDMDQYYEEKKKK